MLSIFVEVNDPSTIYLDGSRSFRPIIPGDWRRRLTIRSSRAIAGRITKILFGFGPASFVFEDKDVTAIVLEDRRIDYAEASIIEKTGRREATEVFRSGHVDAMVSSIVTAPIGCGKSSWNRRRPEQQIFSPIGVIEKFRRPDVQRRRLVAHRGKPALSRPLNEILRRCIADYLI